MLRASSELSWNMAQQLVVERPVGNNGTGGRNLPPVCNPASPYIVFRKSHHGEIRGQEPLPYLGSP